MDAVSERQIAGDGTAERDWRAWLRAQPLPEVQAGQLVRPLQRAVVVAPHPDDEVLMVGGLLAQLAHLARRAVVVAVTDGEASHAGSRRWTPAALARQRKDETDAALRALGLHASVLRLGLADGGVAAQAGRLARRLQALLTPDDVVFTTWMFDGHPDHEACARATRAAAAVRGARLYEVPVWGWHWAPVGAVQMPWDRGRLLALPADALARKRAAVRAFASQWQRDPDCPHTPVLRPSTLERVERPFEVLFA
ncbi:PIG-L deacetylase family protein [Pseudorhodoferax sp. Leaf274]|uniref:PIG-L deacetylase family protein n=1 Tax=Pseudorhodoferax sp. Leaf274 TaxID=1736318 RepID=UPI0007039FE0|nr:PIG-L family deacetylase [Pseudorhodoferax sp. Leaf274]KQP35462.1 acetylglucosaminylphosphatidylinositol deacetylase [Pseudorhodoferax sp. Leaf274]